MSNKLGHIVDGLCISITYNPDIDLLVQLNSNESKYLMREGFLLVFTRII